jgi:sulfur carrier protein ThiS
MISEFSQGDFDYFCECNEEQVLADVLADYGYKTLSEASRADRCAIANNVERVLRYKFAESSR